MADAEQQFDEAMRVVERMAAKIMTLPKEKRGLVIDSIREAALGEFAEDLDLKNTEAEHFLGLIVRAIEVRVHEMEAGDAGAGGKA
jgi:hypothetical protein